MSDLELQTLLDFNEEDLIANRDCRFSTRQRELLSKAAQSQKTLLLGTGLVLILIIAGNAFAVISNAIEQVDKIPPPSQPQLISLVFGLGIPTLVLGFFAWSAFKYARSKEEHSIQQARGKVHFVKTEKALAEKRPNGSIFYRRFEIYDLYIGTVRFDHVNEKITDIIENGDIYAFYYTKDTKTILSAECLAKGK
jgi:hypothetical protein